MRTTLVSEPAGTSDDQVEFEDAQQVNESPAQGDVDGEDEDFDDEFDEEDFDDDFDDDFEEEEDDGYDSPFEGDHGDLAQGQIEFDTTFFKQ